jgi:hypothetical protein
MCNVFKENSWVVGSDGQYIFDTTAALAYNVHANSASFLYEDAVGTQDPSHLDRETSSLNFMSSLLAQHTETITFEDGSPPLVTNYYYFDPVTGVPNPDYTPILLQAQSSTLYNNMVATIAKIHADGKDFNDPAIQAQYGLVFDTTTGSITPTGTAADAFITSATTTFSASLERIKTNLDGLISKAKAIPGGGASPLVTQLQVIRDDFDNVTTVSEWVKDYDTIGNEGNYQRHMNDAITASQAFNDTERENLRRVMFVYEEFYKSATAMLDKLNTIIEKMGSAIKG